MRRILSGHLNNKGVTLITLIIAITIFAVFITVFSYVMISKHESEALYVQSTQAYAVAQAGIEYGIRYAADDDDHYAELLEDQNFSEELGNGRTFFLIYTPANGPSDDGADGPSTLKSTGTVGLATRQIILNNFVGFVSGLDISTAPSDPANTP